MTLPRLSITEFAARSGLWARRYGSRAGRASGTAAVWSKLPPMRCRRILTYAMVTLSWINVQASVQDARSSSPIKPEVVLTKLTEPVYPRLAQQARITGDVEIRIRIRPNGAVESAEVVNGHAMLKQAALDSAQRSQFECRLCGETAAEYSLTYRFTIAPSDAPKDCDAIAEMSAPPAQIDLSKRLITLFAWQLWTCDPACTITRSRSAKCLYLWNCSRSCL